jgi:hypothetical protein
MRTSHTFNFSPTEKAIHRLLTQEPTQENIESFSNLMQELTENHSIFLHLDRFKHVINYLTKMTQIKTKTPIWQLILASTIFHCYTQARNFKDTESIFTDTTLKWAHTILDLPKTNHPQDTECRLYVCSWIASFHENRNNFPACIHIQEKALDIIKSSPTTTEIDIAAMQSKIVSTRTKYLPKHATLEDHETRQLILAIEEVIDFQQQQKNPDLKLLNDAKLQLGSLYSSLPLTPQTEPDLEKAVFWLEQVKDSYEVKKWLNKPTIQQARHRVNQSLERIARIAYTNLLQLMNCYLNKDDINVFKSLQFEILRYILTHKPDKQSTYECVLTYQKKLNEMDKNLLFAHRTSDWELFFYNAFSILTIIPAIIRMSSSYYNYGTCQFWKSESQMAIECAEKTIADVNFGRILKR